ncbi:replication initiation protein [Moraxella marmotae]|uniref:replication initiation protein n=1 Tax=Moraxella marmotae TaxID=3344520 RepID=UPI0035F3088A
MTNHNKDEMMEILAGLVGSLSDKELQTLLAKSSKSTPEVAWVDDDGQDETVFVDYSDPDLDLDNLPSIDEPAEFERDFDGTLTVPEEDYKPITPTKDKWGRVYSDKYVVMQNKLIHAISHLSLNERRLVLMLATTVRGAVEQNPKQKTFTIRASDFGELYNIHQKTRYDVLEQVSKSLHGKVFYFWDFDENHRQISINTKGVKRKGKEVGVSWVGKAEYRSGEGCVDILLIDDVIEMLCIFDQMNPYTKYQKEWITKLGGYGMVLLDLILSSAKSNRSKLMAYQGDQGKMQAYYTIEHLREKFDCMTRYEKTHDFKRYVIESAKKDIEKHTPIRLRIDYDTVGRSVVGLWFGFDDLSVKPKKQLEQKNEWQNFKMSDKQLQMFADKLHKTTGLDVQTIKDELCDIKRQQKYIEALQNLNYKPSGWYDDEDIAKQQKMAQEKAAAAAAAKAREQALKDAWQHWLANATDDELVQLGEQAFTLIQSSMDKAKWQHAQTPRMRASLLEKYFRMAFEAS